MKKIIKVNIVIFVIFSLLLTKSFAEGSDNFKIDHEGKIGELEQQKQILQKKNDEFSSQLQFVNEELSNMVVEVAELTQNIYQKQIEIDELTSKTELLEKRIEKTKKELEEATQKYQNQKELLEKRLVAMYEMGETTYLDFLLSSKGLTGFLSNYYYISEITTTDSELLKIVEEQKTRVEDLMSNLQKNESEFEKAKSELEKSRIAISNMLIIKNQRVDELSQEELALQQQVEEYQTQIQEIESEIRLLSIANNNSVYIGGDFLWPVPGYTRVSSQFGMRTHPITGVYKLHTGTDISAPMGSTFVASNAGVVTKSGYNGAYGNMVIVDHGGGISTLYAHGSEILVQVGQVVEQGTPLLKVGSTGYSTGPHAHFEIRINGEYVNPLQYLRQEVSTQIETSEEVEI